MPTGPARRHHVVSKFYLRYFANEAQQVETVMLPGDRRFVQAVGDASVRTDYYTTVDHDGVETDAAERAFSEVEGVAAEAWRCLEDGAWPLPDNERESMAAWLALQVLRGPANRTAMNQIANLGLYLEISMGGRRRVRDRLRAAGQPFDDETVNREWIDLFRNPYEVGVTSNHHVLHLAELLPAVAEGLLDRWWVMTSFERKALATSDHPVHVVPNERFTAMGLGTGITNADQIIVPLSRRRSLVMAHRQQIPGIPVNARDVITRGVAKNALFANSCAVQSARMFLFHHPDDNPLGSLEPLPEPRTSEVLSSQTSWGFMSSDDRQVLLDAGLVPPEDQQSTG